MQATRNEETGRDQMILGRALQDVYQHILRPIIMYRVCLVAATSQTIYSDPHRLDVLTTESHISL